MTVYGRAAAAKALSRASRRENERGMNRWRDVVDWVGGFPFEVASPERVFDFYRARGFELERLITCRGGHGCNSFVFRRSGAGV